MAWRPGVPSLGSSEVDPPVVTAGVAVTDDGPTVPIACSATATPPPPSAGDASARTLTGRVYRYGLTPAQAMLRDRVVVAGSSLRDRLRAVHQMAYSPQVAPGDVRAVKRWLFAIHDLGST